MSWPDYESDFAFDIWETMKRGSELVYIGESEGGCNANEKFFKSTHPYIQNINLAKNFVSFPGIHDSIHVYKKR